MRNRQTVKLKY